MIASWVGDAIHMSTAMLAESAAVMAVFQAMISPASYHLILRAAMMSKTVTPPAWTWSKSPVCAMYAARPRAMLAIRVSSRTGTRPRATRWALTRDSVCSSAARMSAAVGATSVANAAAGTRIAMSARGTMNRPRRRVGEGMGRWSRPTVPVGTARPSASGASDGHATGPDLAGPHYAGATLSAPHSGTLCDDTARNRSDHPGGAQ